MTANTNTMGEKRSIDTAKEASTTLVALNNTVVNMRGCVKAAKVQVIHKLTRMIQKLKTKKGTEEQKEKNIKKAQRMLDELFAIKELNVDKVSKFALQNTTSFAEASRQSTASVEFRTLARLAEHKLLSAKVKAFREEHSDWRELADFLYSKQTGRRFKTKKQKLRAANKASKFLQGTETTVEKQDMPRTGIDESGQDHRMSASRSQREHVEGEKTNISSSATDSSENIGASFKEDSKVKQNKRENKGEGSEISYDDGNEGSSSSGGDGECDMEQDIEKVGKESEDDSDEDSDQDSNMDENSSSEEEKDGQHLRGERDDEDTEESDDEDEEEEQCEEDSAGTEKHYPGKEEESDEEEDEVSTGDSGKDRSEEEGDSEWEDSSYSKTSANKKHKYNKSSKEPDRAAMLFENPSEPSVVKDPFFVCDDEDSDAEDTKSGHWIQESSLEHANNERFRGGKSRRRGVEREENTGRQLRQKDDRWLTGDFISDGSGRDFRGRGRGRFIRGRGDSRGGRDGASRSWENNRRGRGSDRFQGVGRGDRGRGSSWRGRGRSSDSHRGQTQSPIRGSHGDNRRGRGKDFDRSRGPRGFSFGNRDSRVKVQGITEKAGAKKTENQGDFSHPSWEAKRKRKELEKTAAFSGKRIKFDD